MSFHRTPKTQDHSTTFNHSNGYGLPKAARKGAKLIDPDRKDREEQHRRSAFEFNPGEGWYQEYVTQPDPKSGGKRHIARHEGRLGYWLICRVHGPFQVWGGDGKLYHTSSRPGPK
ncbi:MAG: hypothetical protein ABIY37_03995 [Devosia sp.]